mmetsp:Transcript_88395/g.270543  ORF Transcript_88395/g.270543 Transcript_88395/m.270543 type:complete len:190 (-) Transcript_88395:231-800(-)
MNTLWKFPRMVEKISSTRSTTKVGNGAHGLLVLQDADGELEVVDDAQRERHDVRGEHLGEQEAAEEQLGAGIFRNSPTRSSNSASFLSMSHKPEKGDGERDAAGEEQALGEAADRAEAHEHADEVRGVWARPISAWSINFIGCGTTSARGGAGGKRAGGAGSALHISSAPSGRAAKSTMRCPDLAWATR